MARQKRINNLSLPDYLDQALCKMVLQPMDTYRGYNNLYDTTNKNMGVKFTFRRRRKGFLL